MLDKIKGGFFGFAIGDALAATTEFMTKGQIRWRYGTHREMIGGGPFGMEKGETTDDTAMSLAVAKGILACPENPIPIIGEEFLAWYHSRPKDIGNIIYTVFQQYDGDWNHAAETAHFGSLKEKSAGNGSLMRCLPIALFYKDIETMEHLTRLQSRMTHYDKIAEDTCVIYNRIAYRVLQGEDLRTAIKEETLGSPYENDRPEESPTCPPSGYVVDTMKWVLYWLWNSDTYEDVAIGAANEGGDTDTIAAIAGGVMGMVCGYGGLPEKWISELLNRNEIHEVCEGLLEKMR